MQKVRLGHARTLDNTIICPSSVTLTFHLAEQTIHMALLLNKEISCVNLF